MASIDDVHREVQLLSQFLWRGPTTSRGVVLAGLVPQTHRQVMILDGGIGELLKRVAETDSLLKAVNDETLGRIEGEIKESRQFLNEVNQRTLGRIEGEINDVREEMAGVHMKLDGLKDEIEEETLRLHAHLDAIERAIANLA